MSKRRVGWLVLALSSSVIAGGSTSRHEGKSAARVGGVDEAKTKRALAKLPLAFEANEGQLDATVRFAARRGGAARARSEGTGWQVEG